MTLYDIVVPAAALAIAGAGIVWVRYTDRRFDRRRNDPPAE